MGKDNKLYTLLERLELDLSFLEPIFVSELTDLGIFDLNDDWKIRDLAIGGGQLVSICEKHLLLNNISPSERIYGCEKRKLNVEYAIKTHNLQGNYLHTGDYLDDQGNLVKPKFDNISFLSGERDFKYIDISNYPYNDGSINNNVIWNKFITDVRKSDADAVSVVVQASFLSQQFKGMAKSVKQDLIALGCYKIVVNDYDDFDQDKAKVKTCIVFCRKGYVGTVVYIERKTELTVQRSLELPFDMIFEPNDRKLLNEIDTARLKSFSRFPQYKIFRKDNFGKWAVGCYYKTENFEQNPLKPFVIIPPNSDKEKNYYVVFGSADSEQEAQDLKIKLESFWFNDAVQAVLILTRYQISLDATQYAKIPKTDIDRVFAENELFDLWNISEPSREAARNLVKNCNHKKKTDAENN